MELRVFTEPQQGATYDDLLAVAQEAERLGFGAFFRSDHYLTMSGDGLPGPTDAWVTLGGIARETSTIRLGTLMTSATFRYPGPLAIQVAQVDQMSGGRVEIGFGAGWFEAEHRAYAIPFPDTATRFDRFEEQLAIVTGLWGTEPGTTFSFKGEHYEVTDSPGLPKPTQPKVPLLIGGFGKTRTPRLAARYADEFNIPFGSLDDTKAQFARVREAMDAAGRDASSMTFSNALVVCVGEDEAEFERRAAAIGREKDDLRENGVAGTVPEAIEKIKAFEALGSQRVYLQFLDVHDLDHLRLVAGEVMPAV